MSKPFARYVFGLALISLVALLVPAAGLTTAQVVQGATMTVLAGQVAVLRPNGSAVQPAPSGTDVFPGDEIRTLNNSGALITFFAGTEIELGADTILVVQSISRPGERVDVALRQVAGASVSRVHSFIDAGGGYRLEAGGVAALVRGSELAVLGPRDGIVVFINVESSVPMIVQDCILQPGVGMWFRVEPDGRGGWRVLSRCHELRADLRGGPWNALEEAFTLAQQDEQGDTRGRPAGQVPGGQVQEIRSELEKKKDDDESPTTTTGGTVTVNPEVVVTTTTTTTAPVTITTGAASTTVVTVTSSQTTTVPLTTTTSVTTTVTGSPSSTVTVPVTSTVTITQPQTVVTSTTTTITTETFFPV